MNKHPLSIEKGNAFSQAGGSLHIWNGRTSAIFCRLLGIPFIPEQKGAPPPTTHRASTVLEAAEGAMNRWVCDCNDGAAVAAGRQLTSPEDPMVN